MILVEAIGATMVDECDGKENVGLLFQTSI
jgi:hypothetical protein